MRLPRLSFLAGMCFCLSVPLSAADKYVIRNHFESGKVYTLENVMEMSAGMPGGGGGANQQNNVTQTMTISVKDEPGTGNRLATVKFSGLKATMTMMGQTMTYDSADPSKSQPFLQQTMGAILGKEFTLVYDKDDKVIEVRGTEALASTPVAGAKGMDGKQLADSFIKSQEMFLPPQAVAPGDTWTYDGKTEMPPVGTLQSKGTGKFDSIVDADGHKHAKLTITGSLSMADAAIPVKLGEGSAVTVEMLYDLDRRIADTTTTNNEIKINAAGQELPMKQKDVAKLTVADAPKEGSAPPAPAK